MAHEAARLVAKGLRVPLVADFRDPWVLPDSLIPPEYDGPVWRRLTETYEARACRDAALVVLNTEASRAWFRARYPGIAEKCIAVMNGADPEVRAHIGAADPDFLIVHAGALYVGRDPRPLLRGVREFLQQRPAARSRTRLLFVGERTYEGTPVEAIADSEGMGGVVECRGTVPRPDALRCSASAAVNVVLQQDLWLSIPSKVFDYMQFPAAILALCRGEDATRRLLEGTAAGVADPDDVPGIARLLVRWYDDWEQGRRPDPLNADDRFDRSRQVEHLLDEVARVSRTGTARR
jgi:hypothetical protein